MIVVGCSANDSEDILEPLRIHPRLRIDEFARIRQARDERRQGDSGGGSTRLVYLGLMEDARGVGTLVTPVRRVLGETGAGVTFRDRDSADLTRALRTFHEDPGRSDMGRGGIQAVRSRCHWEQDAERLQTALRRVVGPLNCTAEMKEGRLSE